MNILQLLNSVLGQSTFIEKGTFFNSSDPDDVQMKAIANRVSYEILNYYTWGALRKQFTIKMQSGVSVYGLPDDLQGIIPDSMWQDKGSRPAEFPVPDGRWYMYKFSSFSDGGTYRVKKYGNTLQIEDPDDGQDIAFEYMTKYPVLNSQGIPKEFFTADSDTYLLDDQLFILGVQAHWQQAKQMPAYMEHYSNYMSKMSEAIGRDAGGSVIGGKAGVPNRSPYYPLWQGQ